MGSTGAQVAATALLFIGIILSIASICKYLISFKNNFFSTCSSFIFAKSLGYESVQKAELFNRCQISKNFLKWDVFYPNNEEALNINVKHLDF